MLEMTELLANGFLPTRASWMLDFVVVAMALVLVALAFSIFQVKSKRNLALHRTIQLVTAVVLLFALIAFEVDVRFLTDWRALAEPSPYYESGLVNWSLWIHLTFAVPTPIVWAIVIVYAMKRFRESFSAGDFNRVHRRWGWIATGMMVMTAVTGWVFYYLAFVA